MRKDSNQLFIKIGDLELRANTVEEMEKLAKIVDILPKNFLIRLGKLCASGHGKEVTIILLTLATIMLGLGAFFSRKRIKKFIKKRIAPMIAAAERKLGLPWRSEVVDVDCEEIPEDESSGEDDELPEEEVAPKPTPKTWSEKFIEEYGPMPELPRILQFVVERSPAGYEVAMTVTLLCAFAALCFSKVRAKYLDGKVHAPNLQVLVEGNWGTGKEKFMTALTAMFKRLFDRDKEKFLSAKEGQIIQWAGVTATESKFIDIMANNGEVHVLMVSSEVLAAVNNMRKQNGLTAEYYRKAFDNGEVYRGNKSKDAQGLFRVFMNYIMTGTPGDTTKFFSKELEGGTASRICLLAIPDSGRYLEALVIEDSKELEEIRDQIDEWNQLYCYEHDESSDCDIPADEHFIDLGYVNDGIKAWIDDQWLRTNDDPSDPRRDARGRMGAIAFHLAMVIHMLFGCPGSDMVQSRRKVVALTIYLANYCMERFLHKFGGIQRVQRELNNLAETVDTPTVNQGTQYSSPQPDEENYSGGLSKSMVIEMTKYYDQSDEIGYGTVVKKFGLPPGEASKKMVSRAIRKWKREQQGK